VNRFVMLLVLFAAGAVLPQEKASVLTKKWEYKIMERVYLATPSGWINHMPWLISSPAIGNLGNGGPDLEVVTGTEEGFGEWFPRGQNSGRYVCVSSKGTKVWEYETKNNAGRASPAIADVDGDGALDCTGGSTSGWMVHCFDKDGAKKWRFECKNHSNVLAAPATADLTSDAGLETIGVALDGNVYCISAAGKELWSCAPAGESRGFSCCAAAAIADLDNDGKGEVIVSLSAANTRTYCLDGQTGRVKWTSEQLGGGGSYAIVSPAILPKADP